MASNPPGVRQRRIFTLALALALSGPALAQRPATAAIHPHAAAVLDHYIAATGGRAARDSERTVYQRGTIHSIGFDGTWELWLEQPDRWARHFVLGPLDFREGYDGRVAWRTDLSARSATVESEVDAARAREEGWFLNERWARSDEDSVAIAPGSSAYGAEQSYDVLSITAPGGHARRFFVNQRTGFIDRVTYLVDQEPQEDHPGRYAKLAGRMRPSEYAAPTLLPTDKPIESMTVTKVTVNQPFDDAIFSPPRLKPRAIAWEHTGRAMRVPFTYGSKAVMVMVSINGAPPCEFILDTGASLSLLDQDYAYAIGLQVEGDAALEGIAESGAVRFARVGSIALAGPDSAQATLQNFRVALTDLAEGGPYMLWKKPRGILGADFLSRFVVEIDYDRHLVTLYDPATFHYAGEGAAVPFQLSGNCPIVDMAVNGSCSGKFLVDVGNSFYFTIHGSMVRGCHLIGEKRRHEVEVEGGGLGGGFSATLCRLDSLTLGPYTWTEPVAALALHTHGGIGSQEISGNIGNSVLERFKCTFDYPRRTLYLEPGHRFPQRDGVSRFGALFVRVGPRVYAGNILTGSAAYEAGLRWYDEIVAVDGKPLESWTREEVDQMLESGEPGSEHTVTYRRFDWDPDTTVTVVLKDVL